MNKDSPTSHQPLTGEAAHAVNPSPAVENGHHHSAFPMQLKSDPNAVIKDIQEWHEIQWLAWGFSGGMVGVSATLLAGDIDTTSRIICTIALFWSFSRMMMPVLLPPLPTSATSARPWWLVIFYSILTLLGDAFTMVSISYMAGVFVESHLVFLAILTFGIMQTLCSVWSLPRINRLCKEDYNEEHVRFMRLQKVYRWFPKDKGTWEPRS